LLLDTVGASKAAEAILGAINTRCSADNPAARPKASEVARLFARFARLVTPSLLADERDATERHEGLDF
jgi:hypothetical protein